MKINYLVTLFIGALVLLIGCGKPNDAESLNPEGGYSIVSKFVTPGSAQDVLKKDNLLYIAQGEGGLLIVDITDVKNPAIVSMTTEDLRGYSTKIAIKDSVVYLSAGGWGVNVLNAADPAAPFETQSNNSYKPAKNVYIGGGALFVAMADGGVKMANISYPTQPDPETEFSTSGYAQSVVISSDTNLMFVACGELGLYLYDISKYDVGGWIIDRVINGGDTPGYAEDLVIDESKSLAFMACGTAGLQILNYADTNNIHVVGSFDATGYAKEIKLKNNKVYLTTELSGLQIIDVSDITRPILIGKIDTEFALGLEVDDKYVYIADEDEGLIIISIPE